MLSQVTFSLLNQLKSLILVRFPILSFIMILYLQVCHIFILFLSQSLFTIVSRRTCFIHTQYIPIVSNRLIILFLRYSDQHSLFNYFSRSFFLFRILFDFVIFRQQKLSYHFTTKIIFQNLIIFSHVYHHQPFVLFVRVDLFQSHLFNFIILTR